MPISSYLAWPNNQRKSILISKLNKFSQCEAVASTNEEVVILITDTKNEQEEEKLQEQLRNIDSLGNLTLVYAHGD